GRSRATTRPRRQPCRWCCWRSRSWCCWASRDCRAGRAGMTTRASRLTLRTIALGYLGLLLAAPVGLVFYRTFEHGIGPAWNAVTTPDAVHAFWLTILMVIVAVPANTVFGVITAIALVRHRFPGRALLNAAIDLPFAVSPVVIG